MWESRRDFQRVWEGWEAGFMAFHAFHTLSFPWPAFSRGKCWISRYSATQSNVPHFARNVRRDRLSMSALAIYHQATWTRQIITLRSSPNVSRGSLPLPREVNHGIFDWCHLAEVFRTGALTRTRKRSPHFCIA